MAWTAPVTWVAGQIPTAAVLNAQIRDNISESMPGKASTTGSLFVGTGQNVITERYPDFARVDTFQTTTSTSYANLATVGPSVTVTTGTSAFVFHSCNLANSVDNGNSYASWSISGATSRASLDQTAIQFDGIPANNAASGGMMDLVTSLTPGNNTFTMQYRVASGTGSFGRRVIGVLPIS